MNKALGQAYNEEELLLRLLLGVVFPFLVLVALRLTMQGLRKWEAAWGAAALDWINRASERRGFPDRGRQNRRLVAAIRGTGRALIFTLVLVPLSLAWFALFPQTRPLAVDFVSGVVRPLLGFLGTAAKGILAVAYTAAVVMAARRLERRLRRRRAESPEGRLASPLLDLPLRGAIWLAALFLVAFPYEGIPRLLAVGVLLLALLAALVAARPIIEEAAAGLYLCGSLRLRKGQELAVGRRRYTIAELGLVQAGLERGGRRYYLPYSRLLKSRLQAGRGEAEADGK